MTTRAVEAAFLRCSPKVPGLNHQVPHVLGQNAVHARLSAMYEDIERAELLEELRRHAPLMLAGPAFVALTTTGSSGELLYAALRKLVKVLS
jgi:hypothetical protein